ncbi:hypothetical protein [Caulobacter sp. BK020]|uniref:hypothetical protein n=1 Tax=Caulobacter sp. BK020 TaxID=2512117 RepID=UPI001047ED90|nr:hypothetical protein [Caulobacter sp. BK020]
MSTAMVLAGAGLWLLLAPSANISASGQLGCEFHDIGANEFTAVVRDLEKGASGECTPNGKEYLVIVTPKTKKYSALGPIDERSFSLTGKEINIRSITSEFEEGASVRFFEGGSARPVYPGGSLSPYYICKNDSCLVSYVDGDHVVNVVWRNNGDDVLIESVARNSQAFVRWNVDKVK